MSLNKQLLVQTSTNDSKLKIKDGFESVGAAQFNRYKYIIFIYDKEM